LKLGATLITIAGLAIVGYGIVFVIRNFHGFIELGLTHEHVGASAQQVQAFSPRFFNYVSHLQVAIGGIMTGLGIAVAALGWFGVRSGQRWAAWSGLLAVAVSLSIAVPLHYVYGLATLGHLGPIYLALALLLTGTVLALRAMARL
jgi:hypothetical protein